MTLIDFPIEFWRSLPDYPFLPCPICHGVEGCDHTYLERARAIHPSFDAKLRGTPERESE